jgi:hypothetical protein
VMVNDAMLFLLSVIMVTTAHLRHQSDLIGPRWRVRGNANVEIVG